MFLPYPDILCQLSIPQEKTNPCRSIRELWFCNHRNAIAILDSPLLKDQFPFLKAIQKRAHIEFQESKGKAIELELERAELLRELLALYQTLQSIDDLPFHYAFAPAMDLEGQVPAYFKRKLKTGWMDAAFNLCQINRNWDGINRVEDLTDRFFFEDAGGMIYVTKQSVSTYLQDVIEDWIAFLAKNRLEDEVVLRMEPRQESLDVLGLSVQKMAERWRLKHKLPNYRSKYLKSGENFLKKHSLSSKKIPREALELGSYLGEVMRALWGGFYLPLEESSKQPNSEPAGEPKVALFFPFGSVVFPIEKIVQNLQNGTRSFLSFYTTVLDAHRRQSRLLQAIARELQSPDLLRRRASVRIMCDIADIRIEKTLVAHLNDEDDPDILMRILDRLYETQGKRDRESLIGLLHHSSNGVSARALRLLGRQNDSELGELLGELLSGGKRVALRPLARELLERSRNKKARMVLKSLGPIPLLSDRSQLIPERPKPEGGLPLLAEILEDCANPAKLESALKLLSIFSGDEEYEVFGAALADPELSVRFAAIGLLAGTDRPLAKKLLTGRMMFEQHPTLRMMIQDALDAWSERVEIED